MSVKRYQVSNGLLMVRKGGEWDTFNLKNLDVVLASDYDALAAETTAYVDKLVLEKRTLEGIADARMTRIEELEALLNLCYEADRVPTSDEMDALNIPTPSEPPVSTLCAVCDQIKELHPATHEWTAKTDSESISSNSVSVNTDS